MMQAILVSLLMGKVISYLVSKFKGLQSVPVQNVIGLAHGLLEAALVKPGEIEPPSMGGLYDLMTITELERQIATGELTMEPYKTYWLRIKNAVDANLPR